MAKITHDEIIGNTTGLGFTKEMFRITSDDDFEDLVDGIITEQAAILEGLVGSSVYASAASPVKDYVKRAEKCLTAAELVQRRINNILANIVGTGLQIDISHEGAQKKAYIDESDRLINKVGYCDYSGECLESDHFDSDSEDLWLISL